MRTRTKELSPRRPGGSPVLTTGVKRPGVDGVNESPGPDPPSILEAGDPTGDPPQRRVLEGPGEKDPGALTASAAVPRLFLSRLGSLSVFSFGPTSGAQRCLIVRV